MKNLIIYTASVVTIMLSIVIYIAYCLPIEAIIDD